MQMLFRLENFYGKHPQTVGISVFEYYKTCELTYTGNANIIILVNQKFFRGLSGGKDMIPCDASFNGKDSYEWDGKTIRRWYFINQLGDYKLKFKIVSTNSEHRQGIALFFSDFKGHIESDGESLPILSGFKHYVFKENEIPNNEFTLCVHAESGGLFWGNASERETLGTFTCGAFSCAFWPETIGENHFRFHCNDHEYDNDFDDLIFDMEILAESF